MEHASAPALRQTVPNPHDSPPELWDEAQLADYLGVGERFVRRICEEGRIRFLLVARHRRFDPADVADYVESEKRGGVDRQETSRRRPGRPIGSGRRAGAR